MNDDRKTVCEAARVLLRKAGQDRIQIDFLTLYRFTGRRIEMPQTEKLYVYVVLDGAVRLHTPSGIMDYQAGQYSVSRIDTPRQGDVLAFSEQRDFLAAAVELTAHDVISVLLDLDGDLAERIAAGGLDEETAARSDRQALDALGRLLAVLEEPVQRAFMEKHLKREMVFYILCGSCGSSFLQSVVGIRQPEEIYGANSWIKEHFRAPFTVEELAA